MPPEAKDKLHRVEMDMQVAYYDPTAWEVLYFIANGEPVAMPEGGATSAMRTGDLVRLEGLVRPGRTPTLADFSVTRLARSQPFQALTVDGNLMEVLRLPERMVRLDALVERQFATDSTHLELHLIVDGRRVRGRLLLEETAPVPLLEGHLAEFEGLLVPVRDTSPDFLAELWIGRTEAVKSHGPMTESPHFDREATPISALRDVETGKVVRITGQVRSIATGRDLSIEDATGRIRVITAQSHGITLGQHVEVCGVPIRTTRGWRLDRAFIRPSSSAAAAPVAPTAPGASTSSGDTMSPNQEQPPPETLPPIRSIRQYWDVETARKDWLHPLDMEVVVTYCDPGWGVMWAMSGPNTEFFNVKRQDIDLQTGQRVRLTGLVRPSTPNITIDEGIAVTVKPQDAPIEAVELNGNFADPAMNDRIVRLTGLVESRPELDAGHFQLEMVVDGRRVTARGRLRDTERLPDLVGRIVSMEGMLLVQGDASTELIASLWVGRVSTIQVLTTPERDPRFNLAPVPIGALPDIPEGRPARIIGRAYAVTPGRSVTLRDDTGLITIPTAQTHGILQGRAVEVHGYTRLSEAEWTLDRPLFRPAAAPPEPGLYSAEVRSLLRIAEDVISLDSTRAGQGQPVQLFGVVTWSVPGQPFLFIRDSSGGIEVRWPQNDTVPERPEPGTLIRVTGHSAMGAFTPVVQATAIIRDKATTLPPARPAAMAHVLMGSDEAQRIQLVGFVRQVTTIAPWSVLELVSPDGETFEARAASDPTVNQYRHAIVRVTGVCRAEANEQRQLTGVTLWMNSRFDIEELDPAPQDPFAAEITPVANLRQFRGLGAATRRVRIHGTVLAHAPGGNLVVLDGDQGLIAYSRDLTPLRHGQTVDVVGLPGVEGPRAVLREAVYRVASLGAELDPSVIEGDDLLNARHDCTLVRVRGRLVARSIADQTLRMDLLADGIPFSAILEYSNAPPYSLEDLPVDSQVEVIGVYRLSYGTDRTPDHFAVHLRSAADLPVRIPPPWLTSRRAMMLSPVFVAVGAGAFAWVYLLRRRVRHQTAQIRRQLAKEARLEDRQRNIIEKASDFIFMIDLTGRFTLFNPAGELMTGYGAGDVPRLTLFDLIDENDRIGLRTLLLAAKPGGEIQPFQSQFRRKDGTFIWVEVAARYLAEDERVTGALCVARDITERKAMEEELTRARDAAEANTKAKSAFLANMSHEIRTPMNGVIGMSNLLLDTPLNYEQRDFALTIRNSAEALLTVLNDILDFSKIEAGKLQFETLDFDLTETVEDALDLLAARAVSKRLELAALVPPSLPQKLRGDPGRLRQVLLNLAGNAIKFTEQGEVTVSVALESETDSTVTLRFEVNDTGIGLTPDQQERLFTAFSQADVSTTRKYGGTGLGLAISRQIVEQMNGRIGLRSTTGVGSTFWFTVPFARGNADMQPAAPEALRGLRVLGVDDNEVNRAVLQHYLEPAGLRLDLAPCAGEALARLRAASAAEDPYRLVLLDYLMPETDGIALARAIHEDPFLKDIPMALLTSVDRRFDAVELSALGITATMSKPIRQRDLIHTIQRALSTGAAPESHPRPQAEAAVPPMPPLRVLVAEDNPVNQRLTRIQLRKLGYEADLASNGLEVLEAFERVAYDVIFMDCQMPELDGYDTARRLAGHPRRAEVRIIAMTANAMQGDRERCIDAGMDDYLSKPTRTDDLAAALRRAAEIASSTS